MIPRLRISQIDYALRCLQVVAFALTISWSISASIAAPTGKDPSTLLMTINGQNIRQADMDTLLQVNFGPKFSYLTAAEQETVQINGASDTRSQLIDRVLLVTAAQAEGFSASQADVTEQLNQVKSKLPDGMTLESYLKGIGVKLEAFRSYAAEQVLINKLSAKRTADVPKPTAEDIQFYYKQNPDYFNQKERARVSHVLISTINALTDEQRAAKRAEAEVVRRRLLAEGPESFAKLASEVSNCPSKEQGGDLGMIEKGKMIAAFDTAAFSQEVGAIGRVIRTPKGYHVLKVTDRVPEKQVTLKEAAKDIEAVLLFNARDQAMDGYLKTLRLSAKVIVPQAPSASDK
ncbi:MAG: peptidyl-prolyl cis-trans isomerase C [Verrucomicrobiales bacterium]|jgi:peptidyl-prolyl cis-trans isomerase C